jgi:ABC-type microcin C transport system permease subunit YejE
MAWITLDPVTRKRLQRFRQIKRGWYSFLILTAAIVLSVLAPFLAESRALIVSYQGQWFFPTFQHLPMSTFGQEPPPAWDTADIETEYRRLQHEWQAQRFLHQRDHAQARAAGADAAALAAIDARYPGRDNWVLMPPIPWDPYQNDFWSNEILFEIQGALNAGDTRPRRVHRPPRPARGTGRRHPRRPACGHAGRPGPVGHRQPGGPGAQRRHALHRPPGPGAAERRPMPGRQHWLGTDSQGRDVASRLLYGFRISIFFALFLVLTGQVIGTVVGSLQGYLGGRFDLVSQRVIEVLISIPFLYVVIVLAALFQPSFWMLLAIMALFQWISITFFMRTEMYREKTREYCLAARSYGASHWRIVFRHLLPNCLTPLVTFTPFAVVGAIFALTGLDYLGYGLPAPTPSWGELIDQALQIENRSKLWLTLAPFTALTVTLVLVVFIGESVREAFDPKRYARYE